MSESNTDTDISSQPGKILKAARDEQGLSVEQLANELHLRPSIIEAIEAGQFDTFENDVFLKGYYRSYCRLVNLHEARMIELLDQQLLTRQNERASQEQERKASETARQRKLLAKRLTAAGVLITVLLAVILGLVAAFTDDADIGAADAQHEKAEAGSDLDSSESREIKLKGQESVISYETSEVAEVIEEGEQAAEQTRVTAPSELAEGEGEAVPGSTKLTTAPVAQSEPSPEINAPVAEAAQVGTQEVVEPHVPNAETPAGLSGSIKITFSGDCWLKLSDGTGRTIAASLKRAGDQFDYQGVLPFSIVLGDASKAKVSFNQKDQELSAVTRRNGRAAFNLPFE